MHKLKILFVCVACIITQTLIAQIHCENKNKRHSLINLRSKIRVIYELESGESFSVKGRLYEIINDSIFSIIEKGHRQLLNIKMVVSIEKIGANRYLKSALIGCGLSTLITSFLPGNNLNAKNPNVGDNSNLSILTIGSGTIFFTIFCTRKIFIPYRLDDGWKFSIKPI